MTDKTSPRVPEKFSPEFIKPGGSPQEHREQEPAREENQGAAIIKRAEGGGLLNRTRRLIHKQKPIPQTRDAMTLKIERIMEDGIGDAYSRLSPVAKQEFKLKGEQTAHAIVDLLRGAHVQIKKIFRLLMAWLKLLPGINYFFLEQEAKIKADRILALRNQLKK